MQCRARRAQDGAMERRARRTQDGAGTDPRGTPHGDPSARAARDSDAQRGVELAAPETNENVDQTLAKAFPTKKWNSWAGTDPRGTPRGDPSARAPRDSDAMKCATDAGWCDGMTCATDAGLCGDGSEGNHARGSQRAGAPGLRCNEMLDGRRTVRWNAVRDGRRTVRGRIRGEPRAGIPARGRPGTPMQ